jgi:hypothetical protein
LAYEVAELRAAVKGTSSASASSNSSLLIPLLALTTVIVLIHFLRSERLVIGTPAERRNNDTGQPLLPQGAGGTDLLAEGRRYLCRFRMEDGVLAEQLSERLVTRILSEDLFTAVEPGGEHFIHSMRVVEALFAVGPRGGAPVAARRLNLALERLPELDENQIAECMAQRKL